MILQVKKVLGTLQPPHATAKALVLLELLYFKYVLAPLCHCLQETHRSIGDLRAIYL